MLNTLLDAALRYADAGLPVFPCQPETKAPYPPRDLDKNGRPIPGTGGHKKATTDAATIRAWWAKWPDAWIGVPTGLPETFDGLDLDCHEGKPNGYLAVPEWRSLSPVMQVTPSAGAHAFFRYDPQIKSTTSQIAPGVDTRGRDGYVIVAPSPGYKWLNGDLLDGIVLGLPDWPSKYRPDSILVSAKQKTSSTPEQSIELIRAAVGAMPNPDLTWEEWSARGMAIFRASGGSDEGLELFDEFSQRSEKYEPFAAAERWEHWGSSSPPTRIGFGSLAHWADEATGSTAWRDDARPAAEDEFDVVEPEVGFIVYDAGRDIGDLTKLSPRAFLLATVFCKKNASGLTGAGAGGKTSLRILQYLSLASGRALSGEHVFKRSRVLMLSFEDDAEELKRRIGAARKYYNVAAREVTGWFYFAALSRKDGKLALTDAAGRIVPGKLAKNLERVIRKLRIDLLGFDPFIKSHSVSENDNNAMDAVMEIMTDLAKTNDIAIDIIAHTNKALKDPGNADRMRGAGAQKDAARLVYTVTTMNPEEAKLFGIPETERESFFRFDRAKVNYGKPEAAKWFKLVGVRLENCDVDPAYPRGDEVQVAMPWAPPELWADMPEAAVDAILDEIDAGFGDNRRYTDAPSAKERAAWPVVVKHLPDKNETQARKIVADWVRTEVLVRERYWDAVRRSDQSGLTLNRSKRQKCSAP